MTRGPGVAKYSNIHKRQLHILTGWHLQTPALENVSTKIGITRDSVIFCDTGALSTLQALFCLNPRTLEKCPLTVQDVKNQDVQDLKTRTQMRVAQRV